MEFLMLVGRLLLAAVLAVAGIAKLADLSGSRQAMVGFGVPARLAPALGLLLPVAELMAATMLLFAAVAWWGALFALLLLLTFITGISINLARGRKPDCHCFGQLHSEPIGWQTLARNGLLALVALWLLWQGPSRVAASGVTVFAETEAMTWIALAVAVVALVFAALEGWFLINLLQQNGRLLLRIEALEARSGVPAPIVPSNGNAQGLAVGSIAPAFSLAGLHGETLTLDSLRAAQKPLLLFFLEPQCGPCNELLPEIARWQQEHATKLAIAVITRGNAGTLKAVEVGLQNILLQKDFEVGQAYQVVATPSALLVRPNGTIGSPVAGGAEAIRALLASTTGTAQPTIPLTRRNGAANRHTNGDCGCGQNGSNGNNQPAMAGSRLGEIAPAFQLPDLSDTLLDLSSFKGKETLILFWNPSCGYCRQMLDELRNWEATRSEGAPNLLLISTGSVEANRALNLQSPILLDSGFNVAVSFGARGTPTAVLVDEEGRIASEVAGGSVEVMALARRAEKVVG